MSVARERDPSILVILDEAVYMGVHAPWFRSSEQERFHWAMVSATLKRMYDEDDNEDESSIWKDKSNSVDTPVSYGVKVPVIRVYPERAEPRPLRPSIPYFPITTMFESWEKREKKEANERNRAQRRGQNRRRKFDRTMKTNTKANTNRRNRW